MTASPVRVRYYDRQYLRTTEFVEEQAYQIAQHRRHNITHHGWGIVLGLELMLEEGKLIARSGSAIDGYGRELLLADRKQIPLTLFDQLGTDRIDVWLIYDLVSPEPDAQDACGGPAEGTRQAEQPYLHYVRAGATRVDGRRPPEVPVGVLDAVARLDTPDAPLVRWPVYLGRIIRDLAVPDPALRYSIDTTDRVYVDLMAEVIEHPATASRVEIGRIDTRDEERILGGVTYRFKGEPGETRRFAVFVPPPLSAPPANPRELLPTLAIYEEETWLRGSTVVEGDVDLVGTQLNFDGPVDPLDAANTGDFPSLYRVKNNTGVDELRIDMGMITESSRVFVIGVTADDGTFQPCIKMELKPDPGGTVQPLVTILGDLDLKGNVFSDDIKFRTLSPEVMAALQGAFQAGVAAAGGA